MNWYMLPGLLLPILASTCATRAAWTDLRPLLNTHSGALAQRTAAVCSTEPIDCTGHQVLVQFHPERRRHRVEARLTTRRAVSPATQARLRQQLEAAAKRDGHRMLTVTFQAERPTAPTPTPSAAKGQR